MGGLERERERGREGERKRGRGGGSKGGIKKDELVNLSVATVEMSAQIFLT